MPLTPYPAMLAGIAALCLSPPALAQEAAQETAQDRAFAFSLTAGAAYGPRYFGAESYDVTPGVMFRLTGLALGNLRLRDPDGPRLFAPGSGLRGALRVIGERKGSGALAGLDDLDSAVELGLGVHHTTQSWQVYGDLRYGIIGHHALAGEVGANVIHRAPSGLVLHAGPRAEFGSARFMRSYFGVTQDESAASGLAAYRPGGGLQSLGAEIGVYQPLTADWGITGALRYDRLLGDAAASPIVQQGSRDQMTVNIGLTRHFDLRF